MWWLVDRVERGGEEKQEWDSQLRGGDSSIYIYAKKNTCCYVYMLSSELATVPRQISYALMGAA